MVQDWYDLVLIIKKIEKTKNKALTSFFYSLVKLNGGRHVTGVLRGFDPFMNIVLDETVENVSSTEKNNIGMVVCLEWLEV